MNNISEQIKNLELSLLKKEVRASRESLDKLIADDFIEFGTSGNKYTKADILERLPNTVENIEYKVSDFSVEVLSEDLVNAHFKTEKILNTGEKILSSRISKWRKNQDNIWQIFFHEGKKIN